MDETTNQKTEARDLLPGMRVEWCDQTATVLSVTTRIVGPNPQAWWTRVTYRADSGHVSRSVSQPGFPWCVVDGFDEDAVIELLGYARLSGNASEVEALQLLLAAHHSSAA